MIINNKLDKSFGPIGSFSGVLLFVAGIVITFFSFSGIILIVIGSFVGFSYSSTLIDTEKKRVKFSNNIFGLFALGKWIDLKVNMKLGINVANRFWRSYSKSNRVFDYKSKDYRIILFDSGNKPIMTLKKYNSPEHVEQELKNLSSLLSIKIL